jgi:hypothetical protein
MGNQQIFPRACNIKSIIMVFLKSGFHSLPLFTCCCFVQVLTPRFYRLEDWPRHLGSAPRTSRASSGTRRGHPSTASCLYSALFCSRANGEIDLEDILQEDSVERVAGLPCMTFRMPFQLYVRRICCSNAYQYITAVLITMVSSNITASCRNLCTQQNQHLPPMLLKCFTAHRKTHFFLFR